ncbi:3-hydroxy-3-methylglutaryl-coenzyme A reductase 1 [Cryptomeria japonica]|uniref:3-hydroxy-3-methylglutaryl-coenzyme A reductase 1 n=1 Tax=Cryptomeria japonica TaxID=3369 RepID=UPI0025ABB6C2|nr:3-hydroxy-3-methylglutaryl-coenzyme A reductase 1 [Cryptomeria japonica]
MGWMMMWGMEGQGKQKKTPRLASDALPLPVWVTNKVFLVLFFLASYFLIGRWKEKVRISIPLYTLSLVEIGALLSLVASFSYLLGFFGIAFVQNTGEFDNHGEEPMLDSCKPKEEADPPAIDVTNCTDEEIAVAVAHGSVASQMLEKRVGNARRAASVRRRAVELMIGRSLEGLPLEGFDYDAIVGQCCELPVGYVQIPVGVVGPLLLDGAEYMVPMATTEGCLVASTNRGCKAIYLSGGVTSVILKDGMTRAPVVSFATVKRTAELKYYVDDPDNFDTLSVVFNRTSRFAKLQSIRCVLAGRNAYVRFNCSTGDAMGMNMVSKGVQNVLDYLQDIFPDMNVISISGNFCADKKATAVNWIEGRGKSVVCEAVIEEEVVTKILKTSVSALLELNMIKNLAGSAMAGAIGGFNAHAANIVSAIFIATGQDPAQNVESSQCITMMEATNEKDLHVSVTMPCIEVGTVGGGTQLASQAACLNLLGVKGANTNYPGSNARCLARIVAGAVLAGELSLMSALAAGQLVKSHMKYNRSSKAIA